MDWGDIVTTLGTIGLGAASIAAVVAYLAKSLLSQMLNRDIGRFKSNLELYSNKQIVLYSSLHQNRAELIAELYEKLSAIQMLVHRYRLHEKMSKSPEEPMPPFEDPIPELADVVQETSVFFSKKRIYFDSDTCNMMDDFMHSSYLIASGVRSPLRGPEMDKLLDSATNELPKTLYHLEEQFRGLLGVENAGLRSQ